VTLIWAKPGLARFLLIGIGSPISVSNNPSIPALTICTREKLNTNIIQLERKTVADTQHLIQQHNMTDSYTLPNPQLQPLFSRLGVGRG
jgi:hypothetical protein